MSPNNNPNPKADPLFWLFWVGMVVLAVICGLGFFERVQ